MADMLGLAGRNALVVGGGQGMGEATARRLAEAGCNVGVLDIAQDRADRVAQLVSGIGRRGVALTGDVLDDAQVPGIVTSAAEQLGGIDILVSIVGQAAFGPALDTPPEVWDLDMNRNLRYFYVLSREVARVMIDRGKGGAMVCIASVDGMQGSANHAAYGAAKAGLISLVKSLAVEWARHGIRVNAVAPGHIVTPRLFDTNERVAYYADSAIPMKRRGQTDEIGKAVTFLASDLASYVSGIAMPVDGGLLASNLINTGNIFARPTVR
jgi:NAD(P)-dependent dehydrogenase (short-subunit alcohol dehydrogenase family)